MNNKVIGIGILIIIVLGLLVFVASFMTGKESDEVKLQRTLTADEMQIMEKNVFTKERLAQYDGLNGRKALIAINGIVYDVTDKWKNGVHHGVKAGQDVTSDFLRSKHTHMMLQKMTIVGKYINE